MGSRTWLVWCPDYDQTEERDGQTFAAASARDAAELWALERDNETASYDIVGGRAVPVVHVRSPDGGVTKWSVEGEACPVYRARPVWVFRG